MSKNWPQNSGFTLLEILIALSILAIVFTSIYGVYSQVLDVAKRVDRHNEFSQIGRRALVQISRDLDSAYCPQEGQKVKNSTKDTKGKFVFRGKSPTKYFGDNATILSFSTTASLGFNSTFPSHQINKVKYILKKNSKKTSKLLRVEYPLHYIPGKYKNPLKITLCSDIKKLRLSFYASDKSGPSSSWNQQKLNEKDENPPQAVKVTMIMSLGKDKEERFSIIETIK